MVWVELQIISVLRDSGEVSNILVKPSIYINFKIPFWILIPSSIRGIDEKISLLLYIKKNNINFI